MRLLAAMLWTFLPLAPPAAAEDMPPQVQVTGAWARATPGAATSAAVYATVTSAAGDRLTGADAPLAGAADLRQDIEEFGVLQSHLIDGLDLPPGATVELRPGGAHIMLLDLKQKLVAGEVFPLSLTFEKAGAVGATVRVQGNEGPAPAPARDVRGADRSAAAPTLPSGRR